MSSTDEGFSRSWWRPWRGALAVVAVVVVGVFAFIYRFNMLGGTLGGFDNDHFAHLLRSEMLLRGERPLRDFADAELRGAWPALSYAVSAWAQQIGGRALLSEAYLTVGALSLAHGIVCFLALDLSKRFSVALLAAAIAIAMEPRLYNYPKVLMLAVGALAVHATVQRPSFVRLLAAATATVAATLFRHDYGVYIAAGTVAGLVARDAGSWPVVGRRVGAYIGLTTALLLPSANLVQRYEGISRYVAHALASSRQEAARTELRLPSVDPTMVFNSDGLIVLTYYAFWALVLIGIVALTWHALRSPHLSPGLRGTASALLAIAFLVNVFFLRANLVQRFGDAVVPVVLLACWSIGVAAQAPRDTWRALGMLVPTGLLLFMLGSAYALRDVARELERAGLSVSWEKTTERFAINRRELSRLPPEQWTGQSVEGPLILARYVAECTSPNDYLFVSGYAPEIAVLARRRFAAGLATVSLSFYTSEADQRRALERLAMQSVPITLADAPRFEEFIGDYPLLAQHFASHYRNAGTISVDDDRRYLVFVEVGRKPLRNDAHFGLPCFR